MGLPFTLANGPGNLPDATQLMSNFNMAILKDGSVAFTAAQALLGSATNDNAAAGNVGEAIRSAVVNTALAATTVWGNITSISLTAGDWDVSSNGYFDYTGTTPSGNNQVAISKFSGITATDHVFGDNVLVGSPPVATYLYVPYGVVAYRVSLSATTTVYLKAQMTYSAGSPLYNGRLSARRMR